MQTKSFDHYLAKRLTKTEIKEIEAQAKREKTIFMTLQQEVAKALDHYMQSEGVGFNEVVRRLDISPSKAASIKKGNANLTLASIAHLFALMKKEPHFIIKE